MLTDGLGPNALARFDRDVLAQTGVRYVIVLEGVNDLRWARAHYGSKSGRTRGFRPAHIAAYEQIIARAHAQHIVVIGGTILPYSGSDYYHPGRGS